MYMILRTLYKFYLFIKLSKLKKTLSLIYATFDSGKKVSGGEKGERRGKREREGERDANNEKNTNSFPFNIRAREKSVRFIKFRENVGMPTNSPARSLWHPSIVFLGIRDKYLWTRKSHAEAEGWTGISVRDLRYILIAFNHKDRLFQNYNNVW